MIRREKLEELKSLLEKYKLVKMKELNAESRFLSTKVYECKLNNNEVIKREKLLKNGGTGSAAVILPVLNDGNVLLTVEPKVFTKRTVGVSIPAGYTNECELPIYTAKRELMEETGYSANKIYDLGSFYQDTGVSAALINYFIGLGAVRSGETNFDHDEFVSTFICQYEEALSLIEMGYIVDANAIIVLERAKKYLRRERII